MFGILTSLHGPLHHLFVALLHGQGTPTTVKTPIAFQTAIYIQSTSYWRIVPCPPQTIHPAIHLICLSNKGSAKTHILPEDKICKPCRISDISPSPCEASASSSPPQPPSSSPPYSSAPPAFAGAPPGASRSDVWRVPPWPASPARVRLER